MTPEALQTEIVDGLDKVLANHLAMHFVSAEQQRVIRSQRTYWATADQQTLQLALDTYNKEP